MVHNAGAGQSLISKSCIRTLLSSPQCFVSFCLGFLEKISTLISMELDNAKVVGGASVALMLSNRRKEIRFSFTETGFPAKCFVPITFWCLCAKERHILGGL